MIRAPKKTSCSIIQNSCGHPSSETASRPRPGIARRFGKHGNENESGGAQCAPPDFCLSLRFSTCHIEHCLAAARKVADLRHALRNGWIGIVGIGGLLDVVSAVLIDHIKAIVRLAGKFMVHRRWIVAEFFVVCHKRHLCDSFCGKGIFMHGVVISLPLPRLFCAKNCEKQMQTPTRM